MLIIEFVGFAQSDAGRAIHSAHYGRVIAGRERQENRGLMIIGRRQTGRFNLRHVGRNYPVVVTREKSPVSIM
ncbi:MAG: hypothetical protein QOC70_1746 [Verrucomicrobiota bacterium]